MGSLGRLKNVRTLSWSTLISMGVLVQAVGSAGSVC